MPADTHTPRPLAAPQTGRGAAVGLAVLAAATFHAATLVLDAPHHVLAFAAAVVAAGGAVALAAREVARRDWLGPAPAPRWIAVIVGSLLGLTVELAIRSAVGAGIAPEQVPLVVFRNAVLLLALWSHHADARRVGGVLAMFLVVFSSALAETPWILWLVVAFAVSGAWWLVSSYTGSVHRRVVAVDDACRSRGWLAAVPTCLVMALAAVPVTGHRVRALEGFMPTSGGQDRSSPRATSGVGDGDALVAGLDNIRSFAPIDDAPFMTSHEPSLYDLFDDTYSTPRPVRQSDRAISLPPETARAPERHDAATTQKAGREFSLARTAARPDRSAIRDIASPALFHVQGRVPLHLRLEAFDRFDGVEWHAEPPAGGDMIVPRLSIEPVAGRPWLRIESVVARDGYAAPETHAIRVVHLRGNRIPLPNRVTGLHIDRLDRADFFRWAQPGILRLDREQIPELLPIHLQTRVEDPRLRPLVPLFARSGAESYRQYGDDPESAQVRDLVLSWVDGLPAGWPQIERVVERIRTLHTPDPDYRLPADCRHGVAEFLLRSRRGPDHLFAAATVWALRALGYPARLVAGFYVRPDRHDRHAGHTPVLADDVHVWAELSTANDHWVTLEPTPGYEVLLPPRSLVERTYDTLLAMARWALDHPLPAAILGAGALLALGWRRRLADLADDLATLLLPLRPGRPTVLHWVSRLERRCRRAGVPRPRHLTPTRWLGEVAGAPVPAALLTLVDAALYAPPQVAIAPAEARAFSTLAGQTWSWARLREEAGRRGRVRHRSTTGSC